MSWLHSQQSKFDFIVPILMEGNVYIYIVFCIAHGLLETLIFLGPNVCHWFSQQNADWQHAMISSC